MRSARRLAALAASVVVGLGLTVVPPVAAEEAEGLRAGVGLGDLTPPVGTPQFAYTGREGVAGGVEPFVSQEDLDTNLYAKTFLKSVGVHTRPRSHAVVLQQGATKLALVQVDLGGFPYDLHQAVISRITSTGIDRDHLLISATHSHGSVGPIWPATSTGYALLGGDAYDPRVFAIVAQGIADSVLQADAGLQPARAGVGTAFVGDASNNRAFDAWLRNQDIDPGDRSDGKPASINPTATVLRVETTGGRPLGMWSNFALHGTSFGDGMLYLSGDNMAVSERVVEDELRRRGGLGPDDVVVNAQSNGAEGDISPRGSVATTDDVPGALPVGTGEPVDHVVNSYGSAEVVGRRVARGLLEAWDAAAPALRRDQVLDERFHLLPMAGVMNGEPVGPSPSLGCGGVVCEDGQASPVDVPGQGRKLPLATGPTNPATAPMHVIRVGDLVIAGLPFEATNQVGARIRADVAQVLSTNALPADHVVVAGLANGYQSYSATPEEYEAYAYEGSFTLFGRQQSPFLQKALHDLTVAMAAGAPAPASVDTPSTAIETPNTPPVVPETADVAILEEPGDLSRFGQASVRWSGGDPAADDPHVTVERHSAGGSWDAVVTDDSYEDRVGYLRQEGADGVTHEWTETWEPGVCSPTGTYRMRIAGNRGIDGPYELVTSSFTLGSAPAPTASTVSVTGGRASVRAVYPAPGAETIRYRPRLAEGGGLTFVATAAGAVTRHPAAYDAATRSYVADGVPAGAAVTVDPASVVDGCGNGAAADVPPVVPETRAPILLVLAGAALALAWLARHRRQAAKR